MEEAAGSTQKKGVTFNKSYISYPIKEFLDTLAGKEAVPGGGSACALTASVGISTLIKVASIAIAGRDSGLTSSQVVEKQALLTDVIASLEKARDRVEVAIDSDPAAFSVLVGLWDKAKSGVKVSAQEKEDALKGCVSVLTELNEASCEALKISGKLSAHVNAYLASDINVSQNLIKGALGGIQLLIKINLDLIKDKAFVDTVSKKVRTQLSETESVI